MTVLEDHFTHAFTPLPRSDDMAVLASLRSELATVLVVETEDHRFLLSDDVVIGCEHRQASLRDQMCFSAMALMAAIIFLVPEPSRVLCLGLGAGTVPAFLRSQNIATDVVEHDAAVIRYAEQYFYVGDVPAAGASAILQEDAFHHVAHASTRGRYDVVLSDLWTGGNEGRALLRPFVAQVRANLLQPNGTMAVNLVGYANGPHVGLAIRVARTLRAVFEHVSAFTEVDVDAQDDSTAEDRNHSHSEPVNMLLLASAAPLRIGEPGATAASSIMHGSAEPGTMSHLFRHFSKWRPRRLHAATQGLEGSVLETAADWEELAVDRRAANVAMREVQRGLLSPEGWAQVEARLSDEEDAPPRNIPRAPAPAVAVGRQGAGDESRIGLTSDAGADKEKEELR